MTAPISRRRGPALPFIAYMALGNAQLTRGVFVLFLLRGHMSLAQVGLVESLFHLARVTCEVPAGALADRWGRRRTIQAGLILSAVAMPAMLGGSETWYALSFLLQGAGWAAQRGADSALLYDGLAECGRASDYTKVLGRAYAASYAALALSTALGALIYTHSVWLQSHRLGGRHPATILTIASGLYLVGLVTMATMFAVPAVIGYYLVFLNLDLLEPVLSEQFNRLVGDEVRATAGSYLNLATSVVTFAAFPLAGLLIDSGGYRPLLIVTAVISLPLLVLMVASTRLVIAVPVPEPALDTPPTGLQETP